MTVVNLSLTREQRQRLLFRHSYLFALLLLAVAVGINYYLQPNLFEQRVLSGNLRIFLPLMILAAAQAIVVIGGGVDLSVGTIVSLVNAVLITHLVRDASAQQVIWAISLGLGSGLLAGVFNGFCVAYLRLQPIVTTYATSFVFAGLALYILPRPGGTIPSAMSALYRATPLGIPAALWAALVLIALWVLLRGTRYGSFLYAVGGNVQSAYTTGIPVNRIRFSSYMLAGLLSAVAAVAITMSTGTGDARIGDAMTLDSIVAVVLGGTRLSGGQGGIAGAVIGAAILGVIRNIISFANVPTWWQTLVDAFIIIVALAGPGLWRLVRRKS